MSKLIDLTGNKYNLLTVIKRVPNNHSKGTLWECRCDCGNITFVKGGNLKSGAVKSCGCLRHKEPTNKLHGESKTPLYRMWRSMIYRCDNPKNQAYKFYGGRGIKVCDEWHDFKIFKSWVEKTKPYPHASIERVDVNGDYNPNNCIWIDLKDQANNRRSNVIIEYNGEKHNLKEWCDILNLNYKNVHNRIYKLGWSFDKAISTDIDTSKRHRQKG